jgi:hypothetical protein
VEIIVGTIPHRQNISNDESTPQVQ